MASVFCTSSPAASDKISLQPQTVFATVRVALQTEKQVFNIIRCLEVDEELQPTKISKSFEMENNILIM